jgi:hypothetical protein
MATTGLPTHLPDDQLLARAARGRRAAAEVLVDRYLHPAWRLALVSAGDEARAADAARDGVCRGVAAARRDGSRGLGTDVLAATRLAAATDDHREAIPVREGDPAAVAAFRGLEEPARVLLWLTEVEGGDAAQIAPIVGLTAYQAVEAIDAASSAFQDELALARPAAGVDPNFTDALAVVGLDDAESRRAQLLQLVAPLPSDLAASTTERLLADLAGGRHWLLAPATRRALGAVAATIVALSLAGLAGGAGGGGLDADLAAGPALAAPAAVELATAPPGSGGATPAVSLPASTAPTRLPSTATAGRTSDASSTTTLRASDRARELDTVPAARTPSSTTPPRSSTPTTTAPPAAPSPAPAPLPVPAPIPSLPPELADPIAGLLPDGAIPCTGIAAIDALTSCTPSPSTDPLQPPSLPALPGLGG